MLLDYNYYTESVTNDIEKLLTSFETEEILDFLDIIIVNIEKTIQEYKKSEPPYFYEDAGSSVRELVNYKKEFINSLNDVFQHNNLGYEVVNNTITTKKSDFLHVETICKPLTLLVNEEFSGPLKEFEIAIDKYTHKKYEDAVIEACKAFESTMKAVLEKLNVKNFDKLPAKGLINLLKEHGIFESFQDDNLNMLTSILLGLPTIRNKKAGHGDGIDTKEVERSYASFALNLAGSYIVFMLDRYYEILE